MVLSVFVSHRRRKIQTSTIVVDHSAIQCFRFLATALAVITLRGVAVQHAAVIYSYNSVSPGIGSRMVLR
jgi:hypothetical protein